VVVRGGSPDDPNGEVAIEYDLGIVRLNSWRLVTDDNGDVREEFTVSYGDVSMQYTPAGGAAPLDVSFSKLSGIQPFTPTQPSILMKEEEEEKEPPPKSVDKWLDLSDVEGETKDEGHKDEIEVESFSFGAYRSGAAPAVFEVRAAGRVDKSAPGLMRYLAEARATGDAVISVRRPNEEEFDFLNLTLSNARVTSYVVHGTDRLEQEIGLSYAVAELKYTPRTLTGAPGTPITATYQVSKDGPAALAVHPPQRGLLLPAVQSAGRAQAMPMFLRLDGIAGESRDPGREEWIPILGYEWLHDQIGGLTSNRLTLSEIHFVAELSKATPLLLGHLRSYKEIASATLAIGRPDIDGGVGNFYILNLGTARVTSHRAATLGALGAPVEEFTLSLGADTTPPAVTAIRYENSRRQQVVTTFSENVSQGLGVSDVQVKNLDTGLLLPAGDVARAYDFTTNTATWTFPNHPAGLPDGNWSFTLLAAGVSDAAGNNLAASASVDFFTLAGDANGDRAVGFADLVALAQNYGTAGKSFAQGNFNYDAAGNVDFTDLVMLAQRYNTTLAPPANPPAATGSEESTAPLLPRVSRPSPVRARARPADAPTLLKSAPGLFGRVPVVPPKAKVRKMRAP
jgi:type VI secretion system secreted protein Hcp